MPPKKNKDPSFLETPVPAALGILLLVLGLVAGVALHAWFFPVQPPLESVAPEPLKITLLTHSGCAICNSVSSLELLLRQRNVPYTVTRLDAKTAPGSDLAIELNAASFPAAVVNADAFQNADPALFATLSPHFPTVNGSVVMEERLLSRQTNVAANFVFAQNPVPKSCQAKPEKATLWEFGDLLAPPVFEADSIIQSMETRLNEQLDFEFRHLFVQSQNAEFPAYALACAQDQGIEKEYRKQLLSRYHELQLPIWNLDEQFYIAQNILQIDDINRFKDCVINQEHRETVSRENGSDLALAAAYGFTEPRNSVPWFVLDCQFVIQLPDKLPEQVCQQRPDLSNCQSS